MACLRLRVTGRVQGVGFRPFAYRLANALGLSGSVRNRAGEVVIEIDGDAESIESFRARLVRDAPPVSRPSIAFDEWIEATHARGFVILPSDADSGANIHVPPDYFTCAECLAEMSDPAQRRYRYPFTNCTQCGPRYTIIRALPYDRPATSMAGFELCDACAREYTDPLDRRFHAQPLACAACGPRLTFHGNTGDGEDPLSSTVDALRAGAIVAIKGVGGYHLVCDATNADALAALRARKQRPGKPLALMAPLAGDDGLDAVRTVASPDREQSALLLTPERPIVLLPARAGALPEAVAPGLSEVGVMLPYSPLHHLLLDSFGGVVVATSGNLSGEPVLTDARQVEQRIGHVADAFLHHDRPIVRPADDSVYRSVGGRPRPMRLGRGAAPLEIDLPFELAAPVVAAGSHMKNTVALGWGRRLVLSPHIGDLDSARSLAVHRQVIADLQSLYRVEARSCVCDAHPDYGSSRWAERSGLEVATVFHHHAHASALAIEFPEPGPWLVFAWDGVGLGDDGTLWGGETLYGGPGAWTRVATFRSFRLPGGERAAREPWRSALALAWELDRAPRARTRDMRVLKQAWEKGINAPSTSAVGRIFDAAASLAGLVHTARYEGEAPMRLEQSSGPLPDAPSFPVTERDGMLVADWGELLDDMASADATLAARAARFHSRMASTLLCIAESSRERLGVNRVGLCGGVFQNRLLTDRAIERLEAGGFEVCLPSLLPVNDASIAAGQIVEHAFTASCGVERSP